MYEKQNNMFKQRLLVKVEDTGMGIKTEDQKNLFKIFGKLRDA